MKVRGTSARVLVVLVALCSAGRAQEASAAKPSEHVLGTVSAVDSAASTITVKEDGTGTEKVIRLGETRTLLKVSPGAKDLKGATRITPADLAAGDRVDIRGSKLDTDPSGIAARSLVLMSSRELQQAHQAEASAWQRSLSGTVTAIDAGTKTLALSVRSPEGPKVVQVDASSASFTRYSPEHPKSANASQLSEIQTGDQVRIIPTKPVDESAGSGPVAAQKIYSGTFKTFAGTIASVTPDGKGLVLKDLSSKSNVTVLVSDDSNLHKLPPMMATILARRFNPDYKPAQATSSSEATPAGSRPPSGTSGPAPSSESPRPAGRTDVPEDSRPAGMRGGRMANGDLSQMLDRLPKIGLGDLKPGDAVIVSGSPSSGNGGLLATSVIAGVEPIFQAAPSGSNRQAQSLADWGSSLGGGAAMEGGGAPPQ